MIDVSEEKSAGLIKAEELLEKANNRLCEERKKANEQKRKQDNHNKIIMGGIVKKFFPNCIYFEQHELERYPELREKYDELVGRDKRFRPTEWQNEIEELEQSLKDYNKSAVGQAISLAAAKVILFNKKDLERQMENEERKKDREH